MILGQCDAQYANSLFSEKAIVLRTDRDSSSDPKAIFYSNEENDGVIIRIFNDVNIEKMKSNPKEGAKDRTDIHFNKDQIYSIIDILEPYVNDLKILFDDSPPQIFFL